MDSYQFVDGFGRTIQTKSESADNKWLTMDFYYTDQKDSSTKRFNKTITSLAYTPESNKPDFIQRDDSKPKVTTELDALGRIISVENADGTITTTTYKGQKTITMNAKNQTKTIKHNAHGQITEVSLIGDNGKKMSSGYGYNIATGELIQVSFPLEIEEAQRRIITYKFDSLGRKTEMNDPDLGVRSYTYDHNGNLRTQN